MSKTLETKKLLLEKLGKKKYTVTELSEELGLAKSTVSQHLSELKSMGMVNEESDRFFRRVKYFRLSSSDSRRENRMMTGWQGYVVLALLIIAGAGGVLYWLNGHGGYAIPGSGTGSNLTTVNPGGPVRGVQTLACPMLPYFPIANYSDVSMIVGYVANGSPCYVTYVNVNASALNVGGGTPYAPMNGTVSVPSVGYSYKLDAQQIAKLESGSSSGDCWDYKALELFGIAYPAPRVCNANIYS